MKGLIKSYAHWLLKIYSSFSSVPKEMDELNKAQKIWLILAFLINLTVLSIGLWLLGVGFIVLFFGNWYWGDLDITKVIVLAPPLLMGLAFLFPLVVYWVIEGIYTLVSWVKK